MAIYDDQKERTTTDDLNKITGISRNDERGMEQSAYNDRFKDIGEREGLYNPAGSSDDKISDKNELQNAESGGPPQDKLLSTGGATDLAGSFFKGGIAGVGKNLANRVLANRKKGLVGGGIIGTIIGLLFGAFTILQGPLQFIHAAQILQGFHFGIGDDFGDYRSSRFLLYVAAGRTAKGRLGVIANKFADPWEARLNNESGLKSIYQPGTQRIIGYGIIDDAKSARFVDDMERQGVPLSGSIKGVDIDGNPIDIRGADLSDSKFRQRRAVTRTATESVGLNKISSFIGARLLNKRAGVNFHPLKNAVRSQADTYAKYRETQRQARAAELGNGPGGVESPLRIKIKAISDKLISFLERAFGPTVVAGVVCGVQAFSDSIEDKNLENQQQYKRIGMDVITMGSQVPTGDDFNAEQLGVESEKFFDPVTQTTFYDDPGIQQELGQSPTGTDYLKDAKPGSKELPLIFQVANQVPTGFDTPVGRADVCVVLDAASDAPLIKQASEFASKGVDLALKPFNTSQEQLIAMARDFFATGGLDLLARGAERGGQANIGARMAANDKFIAMGGRELTSAETAEVKQIARIEKAETLARANSYEKYFNVRNSDSVAAALYMKTPKSPSEAIASLTRLPSTFSSMALTLLGGSKVTAAAPTYDYGFPLYGYSPDEENDPANEDPYANETYMLEGDRLERMNLEYGDACFGMQITREGKLVYGQSGDFTKIPDKCKDPNNTELIHYRFYHADMITGLGLACYEGEDDACAELNGSAQQAPAPGATTTPTGSAASLAAQILALEGTRVSFTQPLAKQGLQDTVDGKEASIEPRCTNASKMTTPLSPVLLQTILAILEKHTLGLGYITNGCHSDGSDHYSGQALDINTIDGRRATAGQQDRAFMQEITGILPDGSGMGVPKPSDCPGDAINPINKVRLFPDSCNHVHISTP